MKCLVTGGVGFIGSHLSDLLLANGHEVICLDDLSTGRLKNIDHLRSNPKFSFIKQDCTIPLSHKFQVDTIFHLASPASPPKYQSMPLETMLANTLGTYYLLELAKSCNAVFVFASTSEIYGDPQEHPQKETYWGHVNPVGERSCYNESKRAGEAFVMTYVRKYGLNARIMRIFNTYGPRMDIDDGRVVTNFIKQIMTDRPLTINGRGEQTRSFCYVSDLVEGIFRIGTYEKIEGEVINLGNPEELTILDLANRLQKITGSREKLVFAALPTDDPVRRRPDIGKAALLLKWNPVISLDVGLRKTLDYFANEV
ncbi:MAG: UDP-glucuronic acid decarboxylase family protein [Patescibacteria group bacterium]